MPLSADVGVEDAPTCPVTVGSLVPCVPTYRATRTGRVVNSGVGIYPHVTLRVSSALHVFQLVCVAFK